MALSQHDELVPLVGPAYLPVPAYGGVPDPITLFAAAILIARDSAAIRRSGREVYSGLIAGFWGGEFETKGRSVVFTFETPRIRYRSEPDQTIADITSNPPPGPWLDDEGRVYRERNGKCVVVSRRRRLRWTRREALMALASSDGLPAPYRAGREAIYRDCARRPIEEWSDYSRALIWDRLCTSLQNLARWIADRNEPMPRFLLRRLPETITASAAPVSETRKLAPRNTIAAETQCQRWLVSLMTESRRATKPSIWSEAKQKWRNLSRRGFDRAWANAAARTGAGWDQRGRPRKNQLGT